MPMVTKLETMGNYLGQRLPIRPHDHIIMWSCKVGKLKKLYLR